MKKSIFTKLMGSFVLFGILTVITFIICIVLQSMLLSGGRIENTVPMLLVDENGMVGDIAAAERIGGWVEELDESGRVINVYGTKKTSEKSYTEREIFELTSPYGEGDYIGFYLSPENTDRTFLALYRRDVMQVTVNLIVNNAPGFSGVNIMWLFFPLLIAEIAVISLYLRRKIKYPLERITEGMRRLGSGDRSSCIDISAEAEFKEIVDTFNFMAVELEREKAEKDELTAKKNQLLLELSHDIKTPIATIKSYANALEAGLVPEEKRESYYRTIDRKADRVRALSDDMFLMLKMDSPDYVIGRERTDLCEYLRQLCAEYYDEITDGGFDFEIDIPDAGISKDIDRSLFARIIGNLLTNALKYNKSGGLIALCCRRNSGSVSIVVSDDGAAIPDELARQMFTPFVRGDKTRKTDGGTGLGLAISKIIAEKHGGKISYRRENDRNIFEVVI